MDRRKFLQNGLLASSASLLSPHHLLLNSLYRGIIAQARADETGTTMKQNYISIVLVGGPNRFIFDQWLKVYDSDPALEFNVSTATKFKTKNLTGNPMDDVEYATFKYRDMNVPYLFSQSVQTSRKMTALTEILDSMIVFRGYASGIDGHSLNASRHSMPVGGLPSIAGLNADSQLNTFDTVQWPDRSVRSAYFSEKGKSLIALRGAAPLHDLLSSFQRNPAATSMQKISDDRKDAFDLATDKLTAYARSGNVGSARLKADMQNAKALMMGGLADFDGFWPQAVARYRQVIQNAFRARNIAGINDFSIVSPHTSYPVDGAGNAQASAWSIGTASETNLLPQTGYDLADSLSQADIANYAEGLAVAEFLLTNKLCSSIELTPSDSIAIELPGFGIPKVEAGKVTQRPLSKQIFPMMNDMHGTGIYFGILYQNAYYRAISAGILELIQSLSSLKDGSDTIWSRTALQIFGDFGRSPRKDGTGSDHGYNSMVSSVFTGSIQDGPHVLGNISKHGMPSNATYSGSHGLAAAIPGHNEALTSPIALASTMSQIMKSDHNPYNNLAWPLAVFENGKLVRKFPAKVIEG